MNNSLPTKLTCMRLENLLAWLNSHTCRHVGLLQVQDKIKSMITFIIKTKA